MPHHRARARGQGLSEHIITVALVAIAAIAVVTLFGDNLRKLFGGSAEAVAGEVTVQNRGAGSSEQVENKNLVTYGQGSYGGGPTNGSGGGGDAPNAGENL